jgi:hypothetical protein
MMKIWFFLSASWRVSVRNFPSGVNWNEPPPASPMNWTASPPVAGILYHVVLRLLPAVELD